MAKRPRILRIEGRQRVSEDSYLRRIFEKYNGCVQSVRLELQRQEFKKRQLEMV